MRDPLQTVPSPYEVLGVAPGATEAEIRRVFIECLSARRVPANEAKEAFDSLRRPVDRARRQLLLFSPRSLGRLVPNPMKDRTVLCGERRAETAEAWERHLSSAFPDPGTTHSLAVLWYWWTLHEEQRIVALLDASGAGRPFARGELPKRDLLRRARRAEGISCDPCDPGGCTYRDCPWVDDCRSSAPAAEQMWQKAIGYWASLAASPKFWRSFEGISEAESRELRDRFIESLDNRLIGLSQYYGRLGGEGGQAVEGEALAPSLGLGQEAGGKLRAAGMASLGDVVRAGMWRVADALDVDIETARGIMARARGASADEAALSAKYRTLSLVLATEIRTAEAMARVGMRTRQGTICCGAVMLLHLGKLDTVRGKVVDALRMGRENRALEQLRDALSRHFSVAVLVANDRPDEALQVIERLPEDNRTSEEVIALKVRASNTLADQQMSLGQVEDALVSWADAMACGCDEEARQDIRGRIVSACKSQASVMRATEPDRAVAMLEMALRLVQDRDIELALSDVLIERAHRTFKGLHEGRDGLRRVISHVDVPVLRKIAADLRRAEGFGAMSATRDAEVVEDLIRDLDVIRFGVPGL